MVFELGDKGYPQWHLGGMLGGEQQEHPLQPLWLGTLELLLDLLLLALGALWPLHTAPHLCSLQSASVLCRQSSKASV